MLRCMSKRINVVLPDETISVLDRVTSVGTRSAFISRAVLHYINMQGRQSLRENLEAGYRANTERDLAIAADWFPLEEEASLHLENDKPSKRVSKTKRK